jgi:hypothetical protein
MPFGEYSTVESRLAQTCRDIYMRQRNFYDGKGREADSDRAVATWDGGKDDYGRPQTAVWPKLAKLLLEIGAGPVLYIRAQVSCGKLGPPNTLLSQRAIARYQAFVVDEAKRIGEAMTSENLEAKVALDQRRLSRPDEPVAVAWHAILHLPLQLSPLWRFCTAIMCGFNAEANRWRDAALDQYLVFPAAYDRHWIEILPERLRAEAAAIRHAAGVGAWM